MKLIIFDLDQTLVDVIPIHDETMNKLFQKRFGVSARLTEIDFAGRSQVDNLVELAKLKGIPEDRARKMARGLLEEYDKLFAMTFPEDASRFVLPGARDLLDELSKTDNVVALYTGGSAGVGERVLAATGLVKYFKFRLYGTEFKARADMVREAVKRAKRLTGRGFKSKGIVVIGDSVRDIDTGREVNALTIAVATGYHSAQELLSHHPDYLFASLKDYRKVIEAIG